MLSNKDLYRYLLGANGYYRLEKKDIIIILIYIDNIETKLAW